MKKIRWLKSYQGSNIGDISNAGAKSAENFVSQGFAEYVDDVEPAEASPEKEDQPDIKTMIKECLPLYDEPILLDAKLNQFKTLFKEKGLKISMTAMMAQLKKAKEEQKDKEEGHKNYIIMSKFSPEPFALDILRKYQFIFDKYKRFWRYDPIDRIWKLDAEDFLRVYIRKNLFGPEQQLTFYVGEVISYIKDISYNDNIKELPKHYIPFNNCIYDIKRRRRLKFTDKYFITSKIPIDIKNKWKKAKLINKFLMDISNNNPIMIIALKEIIAYCFYRGYPYQKLFILVGGGCNGKSTFISLIEKIIGMDNCCHEDLHEITQKNFSRANLFLKHVNISSDENYTEIHNTGLIKKLTGNDVISAEEKFKKAFPFRNYAKMIVLCNQLFPTSDRTHAFYRRLFILPFKKVFSKAEQDTAIIQKITTKEELSGIAWECLELLSKMSEKDNFTFETDPDLEEQKDLYEQMSDPFSKFIKEKIVEDHSGELYIFKYDFKTQLNKWLSDNKFRLVSDDEINSKMRNLYSDGKRGPKGWWCWLGISWAEQPVIKSKGDMDPGKKKDQDQKEIKESLPDKPDPYDIKFVDGEAVQAHTLGEYGKK